MIWWETKDLFRIFLASAESWMSEALISLPTWLIMNQSYISPAWLLLLFWVNFHLRVRAGLPESLKENVVLWYHIIAWVMSVIINILLNKLDGEHGILELWDIRLSHCIVGELIIIRLLKSMSVLFNPVLYILHQFQIVKLTRFIELVVLALPILSHVMFSLCC